MTSIPLTAERWSQFWANYKGEPQQQAGIEELRQAIVQADPELLAEGASWVQEFRKAQPAAVKATTNPLPVPYLHQQDMAADGWRKCFTTTAAMIAEYLGAEPRGVAGERAYDAVRATYGDTTVAEAQLAGLRHLGLQAHYSTDGTQQRIIDLLDQGIPVGLGMLHHGSTAHPTGGHWILAIGHTPTHCIVHDPYGEQDLAGGTWVQQGSGGEAVAYSWKNLLPRWMPGGSGGWYLWATK
jgi:hypothetical protein